jgi:exodeoxyribonuclease-3
MKIATWNVNSVLARLPQVVRWLEAASPDVLCMQETKCVDEKFPRTSLRGSAISVNHLGRRLITE